MECECVLADNVSILCSVYPSWKCNKNFMQTSSSRIRRLTNAYRRLFVQRNIHIAGPDTFQCVSTICTLGYKYLNEIDVVYGGNGQQKVKINFV